MSPPPPVSRNHFAQEPTPGSAVEFAHHFFYQGSGFFMFLVDVGQLFRCAGHHFMCVTTNVWISSRQRQPGVSGAWHMCSTTSCFSQGTPWMMMQSPSILTSQNPSLSLSRSQRLQHRSLAPRGSTDRNAGWCITGRRVSCLSQLNSRSSHACWKAHYSPPRSDIAGSWTRGGVHSALHSTGE